MSDRSIVMTVASGLRRVWLMATRPKTVGATALVVDGDDNFLLIRQSYGTQRWTLPGGAVKRRETLKEAALRETREEAGIVVDNPDAVTLLGVYGNFKFGKSDHVAVFVVRDWEQRDVDNIEISDRAFFSVDELPDDISGGARRRIEEYLGRRPPAPHW